MNQGEEIDVLSGDVLNQGAPAEDASTAQGSTGGAAGVLSEEEERTRVERERVEREEADDREEEERIRAAEDRTREEEERIRAERERIEREEERVRAEQEGAREEERTLGNGKYHTDILGTPNDQLFEVENIILDYQSWITSRPRETILLESRPFDNESIDERAREAIHDRGVEIRGNEDIDRLANNALRSFGVEIRGNEDIDRLSNKALVDLNIDVAAFMAEVELPISEERELDIEQKKLYDRLDYFDR